MSNQKGDKFMKILAIALLLFSFIKSIYYAIFEIKQKQNKLGGITIIFLSLLGLILPIFLLIIIY